MCMLRIDIAHLIKLVTRWPCLRKNLSSKHFFVRCVGILTNQTSVKEFRQLLIDILCVAFSEQDGEEDDPHSCHSSRQRLLNLMIPSDEVKTNDKNENFYIECDDFEQSFREEKESSRPIIKFLGEVENVAKGFVCKNGMLNPYFSEDFGKRLITLSEYFVLWTAVMPRLYDDKHTQQYQIMYTATSERSESYFKTLKHNILSAKNERVDKVVIKHLRALSGTVKLQAVEQESIRFNKKTQNVLFNEKINTIEDSFIDLSKSNKCTVQAKDDSSTSREKNINHTESSSKKSWYNCQKHTQNVQLSDIDKNSLTHIPQHVEPIVVEDDAGLSLRSTSDPIQTFNEQTENSFTLNTSPQFCSTRLEWTNQAVDKIEKKTDSRETLKDITLNVNAHLNKIENWKGLNKKKYRGTYLRPCPDLGKVKVINTCGFDALTHAVRCGIVDWIKYQQAVKELKTPFMMFVKKFTECGRNQEIYRSRAELIISIKPPSKENVVDCNLNIGNLANSLFGKEESVQYQLECPKCKSTKIVSYKTIMYFFKDVIMITDAID
ncbi:kda protein in nof-fb transposable element [Lasius niger]|uniref:KDa protein in nof-fb transposable element n=1 Tax=Lasius niger TaxID=67767 RepID=A0A0J7KEW9_LASNI|nr:kda protein in nof-fb transposable element [Lasius niger]